MTLLNESQKSIIFCDESSYFALRQLTAEVGLDVAAIVFSQKVNLEQRNFLTLSHTFKERPKILDASDQRLIAKFARENHIQVFLVCSFDTILKKELLGIPGIRSLNIHCGKLPKYRGANILNWVIINGEAKTTITLHEVDSGIDTGPIIAEWDVEIDATDNALSLQKKLEESILTLAPLQISNYLENRIIPQPQGQSTSPSFKRRSPEDGLINWEKSDGEIVNLIRGLVDPWPGARFLDTDNQIQIVKNVLTLGEVEKLRKNLGKQRNNLDRETKNN